MPEAPESKARDLLDHILDQWREERPEIDAGGMALVPRLFRLSHLFDLEMTVVSRSLGLKAGWLDALSALRRIGAPYRLSAGELARWTLLSTGGLTNRLDRMEAAGVVRRVPNPDDRRGVLVELTQAGRELTDRAIDAHLDLYERMLSPLSQAEQAQFVELVRKLTRAFEQRPAGEIARGLAPRGLARTP